MGPLVQRAQASAVVAWIIFALGMIILLGWAGLSIALVSDQLQRKPTPDGVFIGPIVMAVFLVPLGSIFAVKGYRGRILRFDLHEGGVAFEDYKARLAVPWAEVAAVLWEQTAHVGDLGFGVEVTTQRVAKTVVQTARGGSVVVDERFPDHVRFAARVRDAAADAMLPRFEAALTAGQRVFFGRVGVDTWGMHLPEAVPWDAIGGIRWESHGASASYTVYRNDGGRIGEIRCPIPNEIIFQVVLSRMGKLGDAHQEGTPLGDEIIGAARRLLSRHLAR
ncbi:Hypothetical protein A7982_04074 [Minicystis rosea]|nr:Hypothetical protein A7982_04074 [Minicystis rosea]